jgi:hypothetical protein
LFPKNVLSGASLAAVAFLCSVAASANAGEKSELTLDLSVEQSYDTNVFLLPKDPIGSPVTTVRPSVHFDNEGTLGTANLEAWLTSHTFWDESRLDGVDRGVGGYLDRWVLPRLSLFANGSYQRLAPHSEIRGPSTVTIVPGPTPGVPGQPVLEPGQLLEGNAPSVDLGQGEFGARYLLSPRNRLTLQGGPFSIDYLNNAVSADTLRDRNGWFASLGLHRSMTARDGLNVELGANSTDIGEVSLGSATLANGHFVTFSSGTSTSDLQSLSLGWSRTWSEHWTTHASIGVRRLHSQTVGVTRPITRVTAVPGVVQPFTDFVATDFDDVGPGLIGELGVQRTLPRGYLSLSYSRETRTTSSVFAADVNVDSVLASWVHRLSPRVVFSLTGRYEHYVSVNDVTQIVGASYVPNSYNPITGPEFACASGSLIISGSGPDKGGQCQLSSGSSLMSDNWFGAAQLDWQLRKRLFTFVFVRYEDRAGDEQLFGSDYNKFNVGVGFRFDYGLGL